MKPKDCKKCPLTICNEYHRQINTSRLATGNIYRTKNFTLFPKCQKYEQHEYLYHAKNKFLSIKHTNNTIDDLTFNTYNEAIEYIANHSLEELLELLKQNHTISSSDSA